MNELFAKRVRAAAMAAWWTLLVGVGMLLLAAGAFHHILRARPEWVVSMWGPDMTWATMQTLGLWMIAVFRLLLWLLFLTTVWLTIWSAKLKRIA